MKQAIKHFNDIGTKTENQGSGKEETVSVIPEDQKGQITSPGEKVFFCLKGEACQPLYVISYMQLSPMWRFVACRPAPSVKDFKQRGDSAYHQLE